MTERTADGLRSDTNSSATVRAQENAPV